MLTGRDVRLDPVPRAQHTEHLIIAGAVEPVTGPGGFIGEPGQLRAAGHDVEQHPGGELGGPAGVLPGETAGRAGLPRAPARRGQRPGRAQSRCRGRRAGLILDSVNVTRRPWIEVARPGRHAAR